MRGRVRALAHLIAPSLAFNGDKDRLEELFQDVEQGRALLFEGVRSVLVVELVRDAEGLSFNIWIVGGELAEALSLMPGLEALARGLGCPFVSFRGGRKGWGRLMDRHGYAWNGEEFRKVL